MSGYHKKIDTTDRAISAIIAALIHVIVVLPLIFGFSFEKTPPKEEKYLVAKLVRLGKKKEKKTLPQKVVTPTPAKVQAKVDYNAKIDDKPKVKPKKKKKDKKKVDLADKARSALDRIEQINKVTAPPDVEGDPNGVAHGQALSAAEGDAYMTRIADLWNRTWSLPAVIEQNDAKKLYVKAVIKISSSGVVRHPIRITRSSGNTQFDDSIIAAWSMISRVPVPPDSQQHLVRTGLKLKLTWKGL